MRKIHAKLGLFLLLWWQIDGCFGCGADLACLATLALFFGTATIRATGIEIAGMTGPITASLLWHLSLWLVVYFWLAPGTIRDLPFSITMAGCFGIALLGARTREGLLRLDSGHRRAMVPRPVGSRRRCSHGNAGGLLPRASPLALRTASYRLCAAAGLPFSFGWLAVTPAAKFRFDAQFGSQDMFSDVGASEEL